MTSGLGPVLNELVQTEQRLTRRAYTRELGKTVAIVKVHESHISPRTCSGTDRVREHGLF